MGTIEGGLIMMTIIVATTGKGLVPEENILTVAIEDAVEAG